MKKIGLIGGMSWESTALYYQFLNTLVKTRLGGLHSAKIVMESLDFAEIVYLQKENRWDEAAAILAGSAKRLEESGAEIVLLCTNTMHKVAEQIQTNVPFLHIVDCVAKEISARKISKVALLGTRFTMEQDFYVNKLAAYGISVVTPDADGRAEIHRIIFDELCLGSVKDASTGFALELLSGLKNVGAQGVILGCTELSLLLAQKDLPGFPVLDSTIIHCEAAVEWALRERLEAQQNVTVVN